MATKKTKAAPKSKSPKVAAPKKIASTKAAPKKAAPKSPKKAAPKPAKKSAVPEKAKKAVPAPPEKAIPAMRRQAAPVVSERGHAKHVVGVIAEESLKAVAGAITSPKTFGELRAEFPGLTAHQLRYLIDRLRHEKKVVKVRQGMATTYGPVKK